MARPSSIYWASLVTGDFWKWKTFWIGCDVYKQKEEYKDILIIANLPRKIVDHFYSSMSDFLKIIDYLYMFVSDTNNKDTLDNYEWKYKDIIFICDEAHRYLGARDFANKELWSKFWILLTQCRKRNIKMWFCTQRCRLIDINLRRLCDFIYLYDADRLFFINRSYLNIFQAWGGVADLLWDDWTTWETLDDLLESRVYKWLAAHKTDILDSFMKIRYPKRSLWDEKRVSQYVCWMNDDYFFKSYWEFLDSLKVNQHEEYAVWIYNDEWIPLMWFGKKMVDDYWKTVELLSTSL